MMNQTNFIDKNKPHASQLICVLVLCLYISGCSHISPSGYNKNPNEVMLDRQEKKTFQKQGIDTEEYRVRKIITRQHQNVVTLQYEIETFADVPVKLGFLAPTDSSLKILGVQKGGSRFFKINKESTDNLKSLLEDSMATNSVLSVFAAKLLDGSAIYKKMDIGYFEVFMEKGREESVPVKSLIVEYQCDAQDEALKLFFKYPLNLKLADKELVVDLTDNDNDFSEYAKRIEDQNIKEQIAMLDENGFSVSDPLENGKKVLIAFFDPGCTYCDAMAPIISRIESESQNEYTTHTIMLDEHEDMGYFFKIKSVPVFYIFYQDQETIKRNVLLGKFDEEDFLNVIKQ